MAVRVDASNAFAFCFCFVMPGLVPGIHVFLANGH
jgi:hypothetical protein